MQFHNKIIKSKIEIGLIFIPRETTYFYYHLLFTRITYFFGKVFQQTALGDKGTDKHKRKKNK